MASNKIKGITIEIGGDTTELTAALSGVNKKTKNLQSELREVEKLLEIDPSNTEMLAQKQRLLADSIVNTAEKLSILKKAAQQAGEKLKKGEISEEQFRALEREVVKAKQSLNSLTKQQSDFQREIDSSGDKVNDFADDLDEAKNGADGFGSVLGDGVLKSGIVEITNAAIEAGKAVADMAMEMNSASGTIQAKLGITKEEAERFSDVAKNVWSEGFGDSISQVVGDLATVRQYLGDMSDGELQGILTKAYTISDVFGADISESVGTARIMMQNFNIDSSEAFDVITAGYQNGLDFSGDFLDTLKEYSPQFSEMGLSANEAMNLLINGSKNGAFNLDKVADAAKEFNIRIKDGSDTTAQALSSIGLNAKEVTQGLSNGSLTSAQAMQMVIGALENTDDKVLQNIAGVGLFGTQWEDTTADVILALNDTENVLGDITGATDAAGESAYNNLDTQFTTSVRGLQSALEPLASKLLEIVNSIMPAIQSGVSWLTDNASILASGIAAIGTAYVALKAMKIANGIMSAVKAAGSLTEAVKSLEIAQKALNLVQSASPMGIIITIIGALVAALMVLWNTNEDFRNSIIGIWEGIKEVFNVAWEGIKAVWETVKPFFEGVWEGIKTVFSIVGAVLSGDFSGAWEMIQSVWSGVVDWFSGIWDDIKGVFSDVKDKFLEVGSNIIEGIKKGITDAIDGIKKTVTGAVNKIKSWFTGKDGFDTHSPSKWGEDLGGNIDEGVANGLLSKINGVENAAKKVVGTIKGSFEDAGAISLRADERKAKLALRKNEQDLDYVNSALKRDPENADLQAQREKLEDEQVNLQNSVKDLSSKIEALNTSIEKDSVDGQKETSYNPDIDYRQLIDAAVADNNLEIAAQLEQMRNAKIEGEGLSLTWEKTFDFATFTEAMQDFPQRVEYASTPPSQDGQVNEGQTDKVSEILNLVSEAVGTALLAGLEGIASNLFEAFPKDVILKIRDKELARASWNAYDLEGKSKSRLFAPTREQIMSIAKTAVGGLK